MKHNSFLEIMEKSFRKKALMWLEKNLKFINEPVSINDGKIFQEKNPAGSYIEEGGCSPIAPCSAALGSLITWFIYDS
jgi:hypothetical protein